MEQDAPESRWPVRLIADLSALITRRMHGRGALDLSLACTPVGRQA